MPPPGVVMLPLFWTAPALKVEVKFRLPARKSVSDKFRVEATSPPTSILAPCPTRMPAGLMRNTRPLEVMVPSNTEGSGPITRFSTLLLADC